MTPPLHEIVLAYKMESDRLMISIDTDMGKLCAIFCLSLDYVELMKFDPEISSNDIAGSRYFCESLFWASQPKQAAKT